MPFRCRSIAARDRRVSSAWLAGLALVLLVLAAGPAASAGKKAESPPLSLRHAHPSGAFSFRTPESWRVSSTPSAPETLEAGGDDLLVRFTYRSGETGYDALHAVCMLERLAGPMETSGDVRYEYDYVGGPVGELRALDSVFTVRYDAPVRGHEEWRQRTLTVVGNGMSLCINAYAPARLWKKSGQARALLDAVVTSVEFAPRP
jgi:hypothetical protein